MSIDVVEVVIWRESSVSGGSGAVQMFLRDRKSGSAGMPRPISYAVFCLKKNRLLLRIHDLWSDCLLARAVHCCLHFAASVIFFSNHTATTDIYTLSLHDALPIYVLGQYAN